MCNSYKKQNKIFLNDYFIPEATATIPLNDRGLLLGDGVFETLKAHNNRILFFDKHYARLQQSAELLSLPLYYNQVQLFTICQQLLLMNHLDQSLAALRITLTRGVSDRGIAIPVRQHPTLFITAQLFKKPVNYPRVLITHIERNPVSLATRLKTLNYLEPILARNAANLQGFDEGIMLNTAGLITECSAANIFFVKNNVIKTPRLENGVLPGITRAWVIELCQKNNIPILETDITPVEALASEEAFQTNSLVGIQPLSAINNTVLSINQSSVTRAIAVLYGAQYLNSC